MMKKNLKQTKPSRQLSQQPSQQSKEAMSVGKTLFTLGLLYLIQGIPIYFFTLALPTLLRQKGYPLSTIGLFSFLAIPWAVKFLWAPMVDRYYLPRLGKRKSWILPLQFLIACSFFILSFFNLEIYSSETIPLSPEQTLFPFFIIGMFITLFSSTQDIAIDGFAVEALNEQNKGLGNAMQGLGAGLGAFVGGALFLTCYEKWGWNFSLQILAFITLLPLLFILIFPLPDSSLLRQTRSTHHVTAKKPPMPSLQAFFARPEAWMILLLCFSFRFTEGLLMGIQGPFLVDQKFTPSQIGLYLGTLGAVLAPFITIATGFILKKYSLQLMLTHLAKLKFLCYLSLFAAQFLMNDPVVHLVLIISHIVLRYSILVSLYTFFMKNCSLTQAGTDFAIMGGMDILFYMVATSSSGFLATALGMQNFFLLISFLSLIALASMPWMMQKISFLTQSQSTAYHKKRDEKAETAQSLELI